ncbi:hypothetical protein [Sinorhizobium sp. 22678]
MTLSPWPCGSGKFAIALAKASEISGEVEQTLWDEMHDLTFLCII